MNGGLRYTRNTSAETLRRKITTIIIIIILIPGKTILNYTRTICRPLLWVWFCSVTRSLHACLFFFSLFFLIFASLPPFILDYETGLFRMLLFKIKIVFGFSFRDQCHLAECLCDCTMEILYIYMQNEPLPNFMFRTRIQ